MKKFIGKGILLFLIIEILFRIIVDPAYFYQVNSFDIDVKGINLKQVYFPAKVEHITYLFIGSSRMPAAIDIEEFKKLSDTITAINAGRGYLTGALDYWALKKLVDKTPDILKNSKIIIELAGGMNFTENFENGKYTLDEAHPYLLLPYLNFRLLIDFLKYSPAKLSTKLHLAALWSSSFYRSIPFIRENLSKIVNKYENTENLVREGGIKTDKESVKMARQLAIDKAKEDIRNQQFQVPFSEKDLDHSMMAAIYSLINDAGGELIFLNMPLHSVQEAIYNTDLNKANKITFRNWAKKNNIPILELKEIKYSDEDFPDFWHFSSKRRKEYTDILIKRLEDLNTPQN